MNILKLDLNTLVLDFKNLEDIENPSEEFKQRLRSAVTHLMAKSSYNSLMQAFYRLDLPEHQVELALSITTQELKVDKITSLIFDRIQKKITTRQQRE